MPRKNTGHTFARAADSLYEKTVLENGIRVITECLPYVRSVSLGIWANVGSRDESAELNGISHFLEHMVFKGTRRRSVKDIAQSLESLGGYLNAFTTKEHTCFYARVLDLHVPQAMDVLADLMLNATFQPKEVEKEKQVVIEELKNSEDDPEDIIHDYFEKALFPTHALGNPIIGTEPNLRRFRRADLQKHVAEHYHPENIVVVAAGNVKHADFVRMSRRYFGRLKGSHAKVHRQPGPVVGGPAGVVEYKKPIQQSHVCLGTVAYGARHPERYALHMLNSLLGEGMSSRLYQTIREKYGFAYSVYSFITLLSDTGMFGVYVGTDQKNLQRSIDLVKRELEQVRSRMVPAAEIERTKSQLQGSLVLGLESMSNRMMRLGTAELQREEYIPVNEILKRIGAVTARDVQRVAKEILDVDRFSTVIVRPAQKPPKRTSESHALQKSA